MTRKPEWSWNSQRAETLASCFAGRPVGDSQHRKEHFPVLRCHVKSGRLVPTTLSLVAPCLYVLDVQPAVSPVGWLLQAP